MVSGCYDQGSAAPYPDHAILTALPREHNLTGLEVLSPLTSVATSTIAGPREWWLCCCVTLYFVDWLCVPAAPGVRCYGTAWSGPNPVAGLASPAH